MKIFLTFSVLILCFSCNTKSQIAMEFKEYKELHNNNGSKNYEVETIVSEKNHAKYFQLNKITSNLIIDSYFKSINEKNSTYNAFKLDLMGNKIDDFETSSLLQDGTMKGFDYYYNWIINGDKTKYLFENPLSETEQNNSAEWLKKFTELYEKATFVHIKYKDYYFKISDKWYLVEAFKKAQELGIDIKKQFPPKIDESEKRMIELQDITPDFYIKKEKRDTSFMKAVGYEEFDAEKGEGINPINYSAGYHYTELYMPKGDTIKFKRFGSMGVNIETYKVPKEYGGSDDVIFIIQEANELYPNNEFGGMYVIRPRELSVKKNKG